MQDDSTVASTPSHGGAHVLPDAWHERALSFYAGPYWDNDFLPAVAAALGVPAVVDDRFVDVVARFQQAVLGQDAWIGPGRPNPALDGRAGPKTRDWLRTADRQILRDLSSSPPRPPLDLARLPPAVFVSRDADARAADADVAAFERALADHGVPLPHDARSRRRRVIAFYDSWDPAYFEIAASALGLPTAGWVTPDFVAAVWAFQVRAGLRRPDGEAGKRTLGLLAAALQGLIEGQASGRPARRATSDTARKYAPHMVAEEVLGVGFVASSGVRGVNAVLHERLRRAEDWLRARFRDALRTGAVVSRIDGHVVGDDDSGFRHWVGIRQPLLGWRRGKTQGYHASGSAIDVNKNTNPWMATRSGANIGGEILGKKTNREIAAEALAAYDRALMFMVGRHARARVHAALRPAAVKHDEEARIAWAGAQWARFQALSDGLSAYFSLVRDRDAAWRQVRAGGERAGQLRWLHWRRRGTLSRGTLTEGSTTAALPLPVEVAEARVAEHIARVHGGEWPLSATEMVHLIEADFRRVAKVMVVGSVSGSPRTTRNPLLGIMDLSRELVQALLGPASLYWGGCEFGVLASGDLMHFDLGLHPALSRVRSKP